VRLLAIDTSSLACSVALQCESGIVEQHEEQEREHTRILMPMVRGVLSNSGVRLEELGAIVLGNGPGSFIGMRIAASVAQGLAYGAGLDIVPVSSLAAVAAQVFAETAASEAVIAQDAHVNQVYLGVYRRADGDLPEAVFPERLHGQSVIGELGESAANRRVAAGFGWQRYPGLATINAPLFAEVSDILYPRARFLLPMGAAALRAGRSVDPRDIAPAYLREKVAEIPG
jgi:tRNA threonylcarbamoyladenosine biosynthesis protein TsaB